MKTFDLTGAALDWAVAKAEGLGYRYDEKYGPMCFRPSTVRGVVAWDSAPLPYSTDWAHGGPIIAREKLSLDPVLVNGDWFGDWRSVCLSWEGSTHSDMTGPTPLIAAMRCFVASKLGAEMDVPKELL